MGAGVNRPGRDGSMDFEKYSQRNIHFYSGSTWSFIEEMVAERASSDEPFHICDLGCGDGANLFALHSRGLLEKAKTVVGIDISPERIERLEGLTERGLQVMGLVSDACSVKQLANESFDLVICSQLIEHVPDDEALVREIRRLLKKRGKAYISSVIRRWPGIWIYRHDGKWVLDPTHVHEYSSLGEFISLLETNDLKAIKTRVTLCKFPILAMIVRLLIKIRIVAPEKAQWLYLNSPPLLRWLRKPSLPIPGFYIVEVACRRGEILTGGAP